MFIKICKLFKRFKKKNLFYGYLYKNCEQIW